MSVGMPGPPAPALAADQQQAPAKIRRAVYAGGVGNFVEQFDYGLYGYMAPMLASSFFPGGNSAATVMSTYAVLAVACVFRPLGGTLVGRWGDRVGRKKALLWTIVMMGVSTALIGALPTYQQVGFLAPLLLVLIRTFQGMISGGEYVGAVAFIMEWAKPHQRAYYTSYASNSCFLGILGGAGVAALVSTAFEQPVLESWGWRIPFLAVLPLSLLGLWLRSRIEETPEFMRETEGGTNIVKAPVREALREQWRPILVFCGASIMLAILSYTWVTYYPEYLTSNVGLTRSQALLSNLISVAVLMPLLPLAGKLSDRIGRKPMLISGALACIFLVPLAFAIGEQGSFTAAVGSQLVYIVPEFFLTGIVTTCSAELFATRTRFSASAIAYNSSFSIFMGVTPFIAALLVDRFGTIYAVWAYLAAAAVLALVVVTVFMKETYRSDLGANKFA